MRIEQLDYVAAVAEHGSLRRAGEHLHVSQPAISEAITKLERELGVTLLDRRRSGARISAAGRSLMPYLTDVLDGVARLAHAASGHTGAGRTIRIGTVNTGTSHVLLPAAHAHQHGPAASPVEIRQLQQGEIQVGLAEGTLDLGLVNLLVEDELHPDLHGVELMRGTAVAVLPRDHPLTGQESVSAADLAGADFIAMREGYVMYRVAKRLFGDATPPALHSTDGADMGSKMVGSGLGVTVLPDFSVHDDPLAVAGIITTRPLAVDPIVVRMVLLTRKGARHPESVRALIGALRSRASQV
ncbi:LysR family transcriptional regulator [Nocardioides sp.]|uniref:LysR family transcriptional regulator n=1 Tax=Nocardioides sp. TaxID=35761 RepID=UPI00261DFE4D|nr:LysR family transcriptional regulator [Nocardioides sp.]